MTVIRSFGLLGRGGVVCCSWSVVLIGRTGFICLFGLATMGFVATSRGRLIVGVEITFLI